MKPLKLTMMQSALAIPVVLVAIAGAVSPVGAQEVSPELVQATEDACIEVAESRGFTVNDVVSVERKDANTTEAVLSLTRNGQGYKLTCGYSEEKGAIFGEDGALGDLTVPTVSSNWNRLWWLLVPLIGLPLLLLATRGRGVVPAVAEDYYEAIVRTAGGAISSHAGPGSDYRLTGTHQNGDRVWLTGRHENNWTELKDGSWLPSQDLESVTDYVSRR